MSRDADEHLRIRPESTPRVLSLLPAATEMVYALGAGYRLVGRTHACRQSPELADVPVVTTSRLPLGSCARNLHDAVHELSSASIPPVSLQLGALAAARPEVILLQDHYGSCAVPERMVRAAMTEVGLEGVELVALGARRFSGLWRDLATVSRAIHCTSLAAELAIELDNRVEAIRRRVAVHGSRQDVLVLSWADPPLVAGDWTPELVRLAGGRPAQPTDPLDAGDLRGLRPDVLIVAPCSVSLDEIDGDRRPIDRLLADHPDWPAVQKQQVWLADGRQHFSCAGPGLVDTVEALYRVLTAAEGPAPPGFRRLEAVTG